MRSLALGLACLAALACPLPAHAQGDEDETETLDDVGQMADRARHFYGIARGPGSCRNAVSGEIIVCGRREPDPRYEPPPPPLPPDNKTVAFGAPPVGGGVGLGVKVRMCFLQKCPRELYFIDLSTIPEAPPGSDADKVGRGQMRAH